MRRLLTTSFAAVISLSGIFGIISFAHADARDSATGSFVPAANGSVTIATLGNKVIDIINNVLVPVLFAIAFIVFIYGVADKYILSNGSEEKVKEGHSLILWGLIGFFVILSVWGLVNIVVDTFGLSGISNRSTPTFTPSL